MAIGLSASTGWQDPRHAEACQRACLSGRQVLDAAHAHGLVAGIRCGSSEQRTTTAGY
ncbi:MAG TPA: hypothetical protein VJA25_09800 [Dehalococcoidia bacterium]|nr:hypothetical protein [Dehalococcoidia bacterium]